MRTKDRSVQTEFHPRMAMILFSIDQMYRDKYGQEITITSGSETGTRHGRTSLHYATPCQAADLRTWKTGRIPAPEIQAADISELFDYACETMGLPFPRDWVEVILESDHMHIEYQPKRLAGV